MKPTKEKRNRFEKALIAWRLLPEDDVDVKKYECGCVSHMTLDDAGKKVLIYVDKCKK